jgi:hypothetical protein
MDPNAAFKQMHGVTTSPAACFKNLITGREAKFVYDEVALSIFFAEEHPIHNVVAPIILSRSRSVILLVSDRMCVDSRLCDEIWYLIYDGIPSPRGALQNVSHMGKPLFSRRAAKFDISIR